MLDTALNASYHVFICCCFFLAVNCHFSQGNLRLYLNANSEQCHVTLPDAASLPLLQHYYLNFEITNRWWWLLFAKRFGHHCLYKIRAFNGPCVQSVFLHQGRLEVTVGCYCKNVKKTMTELSNSISTKYVHMCVCWSDSCNESYFCRTACHSPSLSPMGKRAIMPWILARHSLM